MSTLPPAIRRQTIGDLLRRTAQRLPAKLAIACGDTRWTYAEFDALVSRLAAGLAQRGIACGDKVAVLARNSHGFAALRFALARLGAVLVPINFMLKADEVAYILRHAGARTLATDTGLADLARAAAALDTQVQDFVWLPSEDPSEPVAGMASFHELAACTAAAPTGPDRVEVHGRPVHGVLPRQVRRRLGPRAARLLHPRPRAVDHPRAGPDAHAAGDPARFPRPCRHPLVRPSGGDRRLHDGSRLRRCGVLLHRARQAGGLRRPLPARRPVPEHLDATAVTRSGVADPPRTCCWAEPLTNC